MQHDAEEQRLRSFLERSGGDWLVADVPPDAVARLRETDHHVVRVGERPGLLLTYHLWAAEPPPVARAYVLFQHVAGHPAAPPDVERVVRALTFRPAT
jgi:hypothetical protein